MVPEPARSGLTRLSSVSYLALAKFMSRQLMERPPPSQDKERPPLRQSMAAIRARQGPC